MRMLALDLGSTFTKAALLTDGEVQREREEPIPPPLAKGTGRYEIDGDTYYQQVLSMIDGFADQTPLDGMMFSTQMHGYILADAALRPITPYVSWRDQLGTMHLDVIRKTLTDADVYPSGVPLKGNLAVCSLLARCAEGEDIPPGTCFHTLGGYIIARLTGHHVCHITNAAPTGMADVRLACWHSGLIEKAGLGMLRMPEILDDVVPVGSYRGARVYPDMGDQQVCAYGAGLKIERSLHVNVGTAGLLGALCREFQVAQCESRPWLEKGCYLRTVSGLSGGRHIQALREQYQGEDDDVWRMLTHAPDARACAAYQAMAEQYRDAAERMGFPIRELCYSGGCVLKNPALRRYMEAALLQDGSGGIKTADIWKGMLRMAGDLEKLKNTDERF